jgi:uncharacterized protein YjbI with pentapeptide repeats
MVYGSVAVDIRQRYETGERQFLNLQLRGADLRGINLSQADLRGADLSKANLREVNLSGANLAEAQLNEADLSSANLEGANLSETSLIKAYLIKANLRSANLRDAYLTGAYLTKSIFTDADLKGAYLNGTQLTGANFKGARYDQKTRFDNGFDPQKMGLERDIFFSHQSEISRLNVEELLVNLNQISNISSRYLGSSITVRYWESTRQTNRYLEDFTLNNNAQFSWSGQPQANLDALQVQEVQQWIDRFTVSCGEIIQDFPKLINFQS